MKNISIVGGYALKQRIVIIGAALLVSLIMFSTSIMAGSGTDGKVSGLVEDVETGQPIVGATVRVEGHNLITMTDEDGEYFIIGIPIGKYAVIVSHIGFQTNRTEEVRILVDLTTPVNFTLKTAPVELGREVVVRATNPVIQADLTSSRSIFTAERLASMPNTISVQSILSNYPGVVNGKQSEMHVRGGRNDQVAYYLDGFSVSDPFTSAAGLRIMPSSLEELSLISGGFTAEYGNAMSGIVNAVTREGRSHYQGRVRAYEGFTKLYQVNTGTFGDMERHRNRSTNFDLSGPIPGLNPDKYTFFTAGEYLRNNSYLPHNWNISYAGLAKVVMKPMPKLKIKTNVQFQHSFGDMYTHRDNNGRSYDYNLDGLPAFERDGYLIGISGNYVMTERMILSLGVNRFSTKTLQSPRHLLGTHWSQWPGYSEDSAGVYNGTIQDDNYLNNRDWDNPYEIANFTTGDDYKPVYSYSEANYNAVTASIETQLNKSNQVKSGFEYRRYEVTRDNKQFYNSQPYTQDYESNPIYATMYLQDKLEYDYFVMNVGLRFDYRDNDIAYNYTARTFDPDALDPANDVYKDSKPKANWSPRLGVSFPISEKSVMHFNYGIYYQAPLYGQMFFNLEGETASGLPLIGNPDLDPERTVSYELGLDHLIGDALRFDVTAYFKDISDLVSTRQAIRLDGFPAEVAGAPITIYQNGDYGSVEGIDLSLEKINTGGIISGSLAYSYMTTTGNANTAEDAYYTYITNPDQTAPVDEFPLDFDQRHTVTAVMDCKIPRDYKGKLFGMNVPTSWGVTMVGYYGSGLPYTKIASDGRQLGSRNEYRLPPTYSVDMRINKNFYFGGGDMFLSAFVEVDNLFDRRNILNVYARTGLANNDGFNLTESLTTSQEELDRLDNLYDNDPQNYSPPRTIRTGLEFNF